MSFSIGPNSVLDNLSLWLDPACSKCYTGSPSRNAFSYDYVGPSGSGIGSTKDQLSGIFGVKVVSKKPQGTHIWDKGPVAAGKLTSRDTSYFDDVSDYYSIPDSDAYSFTDGTKDLPFSIVAWVKFTGINDAVVISKYGTTTAVREWVLLRNSSNKLRLLLEDGSGNIARGDSTSIIPNNTWIMVGATFSAESAASSAGNDIQLYINGAAVATTQTTGPGYGGMTNTAQDVWIGRYSGSYANMWLKRVAVFNVKLEASEINTLWERDKIPGITNKSGTANGGYYTSDFSTDADGFLAANGTATHGITIGSEANSLRLTVDTSTTAHRLYKTDVFVRGERYRVDFKFYIPSTNSHVDGITVNQQTAGNTIYSNPAPATDTWTDVSDEFTAVGANILDGINFYALDGGNATLTDPGGNDTLYIKDVIITRLGRVLDIDMGDDDESGAFRERASSALVTENNDISKAEVEYYIEFAKDLDNHDILKLSRNPASGASFDWSDYLSFYGAQENYITQQSSADKVSISFEVESNIKSLFTGVRFFESGTVENYIPLNRVALPNENELYYATSDDIATGENPVGFDIFFDDTLSSGWTYMYIKKPMFEIGDHASQYTSGVRSGDNAIFSMIPNTGTGDITNNVRTSGVSKIPETNLNYPPNTYWEFNGVDTNIVFPYGTTDNLSYSIEVVFSLNVVEAVSLCGFSASPRFEIAGTDTLRADLRTTDATNFTLNTSTVLEADRIYHATLCAQTLSAYNNFTGSVYLNSYLDGGVGGAGGLRLNGNFVIGDDLVTSRQPMDGKIYLLRLYNGKALSQKEVTRNYLNVKRRFGIT